MMRLEEAAMASGSIYSKLRQTTVAGVQLPVSKLFRRMTTAFRPPRMEELV